MPSIYQSYSTAALTKKSFGTRHSANLFGLSSLKSSTEESAERETYLDMIKEWKLLFRLLNLSYTWLVINLAYYGLSLTSVNLSGDPYLNFFLVSLVEIPGKSACWISRQDNFRCSHSEVFLPICHLI